MHSIENIQNFGNLKNCEKLENFKPMIKPVEKCVKTANSYLPTISVDELHHFGLTTKDNLKQLFGDVKV